MKQSTLITIGVVVLLMIGAVFFFSNQSGDNQTETTAQNETAVETETMDNQNQPTENNNTIVDIAAGNDTFSTLVQAVQAADLVDTLAGDGPFTVFAPTNEAFEKLPEGTLEELLNDKQRLTQILTYHVVPGKVMAADVVSLSTADTVQGGKLQITTQNGTVQINDSTVVQTDIEASNGVIHVVDTVLIPSE